MRQFPATVIVPKSLAPILLLFAAISSAFSQGSLYGYSVDIPADPRSIAMGESFVATPADQAAVMYNPAGLAGLRGIVLSYAHRDMNWVPNTGQWKTYSVTGLAATPAGVFAAQYNRKSLGSYPVTTPGFPDGSGSEASVYSHSIALGYAHRFPHGFAVGLSAKYFDYITSYSGRVSGSITNSNSTPAYLFDVGCMYSVPLCSASAGILDSVTIGMAYQNIGTQWKANTYFAGMSPTYQLNDEIQLPQYFRLGFSLALGLPIAEPGALQPFGAIVTGEFRSLQTSFPLNATRGAADFWGAGIEFNAFEVFSLRGGVTVSPIEDFEGRAHRAAFRYGVGVNLPLRIADAGLPVCIAVSYTVIPLNQLPYYAQIGESERWSVSVFSLDLRVTRWPL